MYNDRGIIKWAPFDALNGFHEAISNYKYQKNKIEKPILLEDKLEQMDMILKDAVLEYKEIEIKYYEDGYIKNIFGFIRKLDIIYKNIILDNGIKILLENITNIELMD
ncbi:YolD-like family protein [Acholeplasma granularum]|uniref:YolD-like family protein n=1 Tax=Acholeplasma granularum TaxID=264635 RepID=UPI0004711626|nr:YolD-like family protein [Acholeplasma granularum]